MNIVEEISSVLKEEEELLLSGNFVALEALVERKTRLTEILAARPVQESEALARLAAQAGRNDALLGASRRGLKAALNQLRQLSMAQEQTTYSRDGIRRPMSRKPSSITEKY